MPHISLLQHLSVFTRRNGRVYHFYSGEMSGEMADPGQDPRGAPDLDPLWLMLDLTPEGRGTDWLGKLGYHPQVIARGDGGVVAPLEFFQRSRSARPGRS